MRLVLSLVRVLECEVFLCEVVISLVVFLWV